MRKNKDKKKKKKKQSSIIEFELMKIVEKSLQTAIDKTMKDIFKGW